MKKILLLSFFITITTIAVVSTLNTTTAFSSLPPNSHAGAPMDNGDATCVNCHGGQATPTTGVISSDIPVSGYIGGTTYNFTVTMSGATAYGFEMTPQTATSNIILGTWISGTGSAISGGYIKHSPKQLGASATWNFQWTAPATAPTVTFYGAFNYANNDGGTSGDIIQKSSITYLANTTSLAENSKITSISIFPNPTADALHISSNDLFSQGKIYSVDGKLSKIVTEQELISKTISVTELPSGVYYLYISSDNGKKHSSKFIKS